MPAGWYNFAQNVITSSVGGSHYLPKNFTEIRSVFMRSERNTDVGTGHISRQRDMMKTIPSTEDRIICSELSIAPVASDTLLFTARAARTSFRFFMDARSA